MKSEIESRKSEVSAEVRAPGEGEEALWLWFGLDRAGFLTIPRVLMHEMSDDWQGKMAALLEEYDETFSEWPVGWESSVSLKVNGRFADMPVWVTNYRHPDLAAINQLRPTSDLGPLGGEAPEGKVRDPST